MEEQAQLVEKTRLETEKLRSELERLAIQAEKEQVTRRRLKKEEEFKTKQEARERQGESEAGIYAAADRSGKLTARIHIDWYYDLALSRYCSVRLHLCSAQVSYSK